MLLSQYEFLYSSLDCLDKFVSEMTRYVLSGMYNLHWLNDSYSCPLQFYWVNFSTKYQVVVEHCLLYFECPSVLKMAKKSSRKSS